MKTRSKFMLQSIKKVSWDTGVEILTFHAVSGGSEENEHFARYTPSGDLSITVDNPKLVGTFTLGAFYYLDLTLCDPE